MRRCTRGNKGLSAGAIVSARERGGGGRGFRTRPWICLARFNLNGASCDGLADLQHRPAGLTVIRLPFPQRPAEPHTVRGRGPRPHPTPTPTCTGPPGSRSELLDLAAHLLSALSGGAILKEGDCLRIRTTLPAASKKRSKPTEGPSELAAAGRFSTVPEQRGEARLRFYLHLASPVSHFCQERVCLARSGSDKRRG